MASHRLAIRLLQFQIECVESSNNLHKRRLRSTPCSSLSPAGRPFISIRWTTQYREARWRFKHFFFLSFYLVTWCFLGPGIGPVKGYAAQLTDSAKNLNERCYRPLQIDSSISFETHKLCIKRCSVLSIGDWWQVEAPALYFVRLSTHLWLRLGIRIGLSEF